MAMAHHGGEGMSEEFRNLFEQQAAKRLEAQRLGVARRNYSEGRIAPEDDGDIAFEVSSDAEKQIIKLDFGKEVVWVGMSPSDAIKLAQILIRQARSISKERLSIVLH